MERLTDKTLASALKINNEKLIEMGIEPPISDLRYVKLAEYENVEELMETTQNKPLQWQKSLMYNFLKKG